MTSRLFVSTMSWALFISAPAYGATYYVDNSSAAASDANDGLSPERPFRTTAPVNRRSFQPGDSILFKTGTVYQNDVHWDGVLSIGASGAAGAPVTFSSYGSGAKPVFRNTNMDWSEGIQLHGASYIVIRGLKVDGAQNAGVRMDASSTHNLFTEMEITGTGLGFEVDGVANTFTSNEIHDLKMVVNDYGAPGTRQADNDYGAEAFVISGSWHDIGNNRVIRCKARSYDYESDGGAFEVLASDHVTIHDNWVEDSDGFSEGGIGAITNLTIRGNVALNNGPFMVYHNSGGAYGGSMYNVRAENNTIIDMVSHQVMDIVFLDGAADRSQFSFTKNIVVVGPMDGVYKQHGDYHSDNLLYLLNFENPTHIYNNWDNTLASGELQTDPMFVDLTGRDLHLRSGSPASGLGAFPIPVTGAVPPASAPVTVDPIPAPAPAPAPSPVSTFQLSASAASVSVSPGMTIHLTAHVTSPVAVNGGHVQINVTDANGAYPFSLDQDANIPAGGSADFSADFTIPSGMARGTAHVNVNVYSSNFSSVYSSETNLAAFTVQP